MPRFEIKQENYELPPTAEQRRLIAHCQIVLPPTRIQAHLAIAALKRTDEGKAKLRSWKIVRQEERRNRAQSRTDGHAQRQTSVAGRTNR